MINRTTQAIKEKAEADRLALEEARRLREEQLKKIREEFELIKNTYKLVQDSVKLSVGVADRLRLYNASADMKELDKFDSGLRKNVNDIEKQIQTVRLSLLSGGDVALLSAEQRKLVAEQGITLIKISKKNKAELVAQEKELQDALILLQTQGNKERSDLLEQQLSKVRDLMHQTEISAIFNPDVREYRQSLSEIETEHKKATEQMTE